MDLAPVKNGLEVPGESYVALYRDIGFNRKGRLQGKSPTFLNLPKHHGPMNEEWKKELDAPDDAILFSANRNNAMRLSDGITALFWDFNTFDGVPRLYTGWAELYKIVPDRATLFYRRDGGE